MILVSFDEFVWFCWVNQSSHHSHTFPEVLNNPYWFGSNDLAGAVPMYPSSLVLMYGNFHCQMLHICFPLIFKVFPQGNLF